MGSTGGPAGGIGRCFGLKTRPPITETDSKTDTGHQDHNTLKHLKSLVLLRHARGEESSQVGDDLLDVLLHMR